MTDAGAKVMTEDILEPDLEICDSHHHLMDHAGWRYSAEDYLRDTTHGHRVTSDSAIRFYRLDEPAARPE